MQTTHVQATRKRMVALLSLLVIVAIVTLFVQTAPTLAASSGTWTTTGSLTVPITNQTMTRLSNGQVLVAGDANYSAISELYTPSTGSWSPTLGNPSTSHDQAAAVLLANGQVLLAGNFDAYFGDGTATELYNPSTGTWSLTGSMSTGRANFGMVRLQDGRVLAVGGGDSGYGFVSSAELYNPTTGTWSPTGSLHVARGYFGLVVLPNGNVLAIGGDSLNYMTGMDTVLSSAEIFNPATGLWSYTGSLHTARTNFTTTLLANGTVLVTGGSKNSANGGLALASAEIYHPATGKWTVTGSLTSARMNQTATLLGDGTVLVTGGYHVSNVAPYVVVDASSERYSPSTGTWTRTGNLNTGRYNATATLLSNGTALIAAGQNVNSNGTSNILASAEFYTP